MISLPFVVAVFLTAPPAPTADPVTFHRVPPKVGLAWHQRERVSSSTDLEIKTGANEMSMTETREEVSPFRARVLAVDRSVRKLELSYGERTYRMDGPFFKKEATRPVSSRKYVATRRKGKVDVRRTDGTAITAEERDTVRRDAAGHLGRPVLEAILPARPIHMNETLRVSAADAKRFLGDLGTLQGDATVEAMTLRLRAVRRVGGTHAVFAVVIKMRGVHRAGDLTLRSKVELEGDLVVAVDTTRLTRFAAKGTLTYEGAEHASAKGEVSVTGSGPYEIRREIRDD